VTNKKATAPSAKHASNTRTLWFFGVAAVGLWIWAFIARTPSDVWPWLYRASVIATAAAATLRFAYAVWRHKHGLPPE